MSQRDKPAEMHEQQISAKIMQMAYTQQTRKEQDQ